MHLGYTWINLVFNYICIILYMDKYDSYNLIYNCGCPITFLSFIGILVATGITQNPNIVLIGGIIIIVLDILWMIYMWLFPFEHLGERFKLWVRSFRKYKLTDDEKLLWESLKVKAKLGYNEWLARTKGDDLCGPWIKDYTQEENDLLDKIHKYFYGDDWYVVMPISGAQVNYIMFNDIMDKIR